MSIVPRAVVVASFYKFAPVSDIAVLRESMTLRLAELELKGTVLIASEGMNGFLGGDRLPEGLAFLRSIPGFEDMGHRETVSEKLPFSRLKVRPKKEIIRFKQPIDPELVGQYVEPKDWNDLISRPEVTLIDTRNDYEVEVGTFEGAIDPKTTIFSEFATYIDENLDPKEHREIAMFCTGGIRCEKATAYLRQKGFEKVYHLQGGILRYLEEVDEGERKWVGKCFVFDDRREI